MKCSHSEGQEITHRYNSLLRRASEKRGLIGLGPGRIFVRSSLREGEVSISYFTIWIREVRFWRSWIVCWLFDTKSCALTGILAGTRDETKVYSCAYMRALYDSFLSLDKSWWFLIIWECHELQTNDALQVRLQLEPILSTRTEARTTTCVMSKTRGNPSTRMVGPPRIVISEVDKNEVISS